MNLYIHILLIILLYVWLNIWYSNNKRVDNGSILEQIHNGHFEKKTNKFPYQFKNQK
jgi:hypothetical protein